MITLYIFISASFTKLFTEFIPLTSQEGHPFERIEVTRGQALEMFSDDNTFQVCPSH